MDRDELLAKASAVFGEKMTRIALEMMDDVGWKPDIARSLLVHASEGNPAVLTGALHESTLRIADQLRDTLPMPVEKIGLGFVLKVKTDSPEGELVEKWLNRAMAMLVAEVQGEHDDVTTHICGMLDTYEGFELSRELLGVWTAQFELAAKLFSSEESLWKQVDPEAFVAEWEEDSKL